MTDNKIMTIEKAMFILRHGSAEGEHKYFEAVDVIEKEYNRQKAEIERLTTLCTEQNEELGRLQKVRANILKVMKENISQTKAEAINEFAERLKNEFISDTAYGCDINQHSGYYDYQIKIGDIPEYIDNLVKEMTEVNENGKV